MMLQRVGNAFSRGGGGVNVLRRMLSSYSVRPSGQVVGGFHLRNEEDYRLFFQDAAGNTISPWHDIPLYADEAAGVLNFVNEIPKGAVEKMEVATDEEHNPIKQDVKKGKLRLYPFESLVNYGCLPQTWEDPDHKDASTGMLGDNDPVDIVEVGDRVALSGEVYQVKLIGILGMIDEGEMDWKAIAIDVNDPNAASINSVEDLEKYQPGKVKAITDWFKTYKMPDGKPENEFAFDDKAMDAAFAHDIVKLTHNLWKETANLKKNDLWA